MKRLDLINRARRNLKQSKARTILTALAIAVGATTICLALAAGNGGRDFINKQLDGMGVNVLDIDVYSIGADPLTDKTHLICADQIAEVAAISGVESVTGSGEGDQAGCYYSLVVRAKTEADIAPVMAAIDTATSLTDIVSYSQKEERENMFQAINIAQYGLMGFGALAILASVFGIINTQYISVLERTREIGLMKALGMRKKDISRLFRYEAAWIGFLGGVIGVAVAWLITLLNPVINSFLNITDSAVRLLQINWLQAAILVASLMLVAVLSGWFPARRAAKLDPIEALRTE
jgi:ABC-type antimicrobial peptide transport system permease subunit